MAEDRGLGAGGQQAGPLGVLAVLAHPATALDGVGRLGHGPDQVRFDRRAEGDEDLAGGCLRARGVRDPTRQALTGDQAGPEPLLVPQTELVAGLGQPGGGGQVGLVVHQEKAPGRIGGRGDRGLGQGPAGADVALGPPARRDLLGVGQVRGLGRLPGQDHPQRGLVRQRHEGHRRHPLARRPGQPDLQAVDGQHRAVDLDRRRPVHHQADGHRYRGLVGDLRHERGDATRTGRTERVVHDVAADDPDAGLHDGRVADEGLAYGGLDGRHVPAVLGTDPPAQGPVGPRRGQAPTGVDRAEAPDAEDPEIGHLSPVRRRPSA